MAPRASMLVRPVGADWSSSYAQLLERLDTLVERARLTLCGFCTVTDATISLHEAEPLFAPDAPPAARRLADLLRQRMLHGIGGELRFEWPEGPAWLESNLRPRVTIGGTSAHAALSLALNGAPALLALSDRSRHKLARLHGDILLSEGGRLVPVSDAAPTATRVPDINVFEYTAGREAGGIIPARSTRIIVRLHDPDLDIDAEFLQASQRLAADAGAGLICGFNALGDRLHDTLLNEIMGVGRAWQRAGLPVVHYEMAGFDRPALRDQTLQGLVGGLTSLGMSQSEFSALVGERTDIVEGMVELGRQMSLRRVCVHADGWAAAVTLDDPVVERTALMTGCLFASARAATGRHGRPGLLPADVTFEDPPFAERSEQGWHVVTCASPYQVAPTTTLGLGDTFTAGTLLVLGGRN